MEQTYDVVVIGAGHAGCEAAVAVAKLGKKVLLTTLHEKSIGMLPCNPSIGGTAKGHLVCEIDALGGIMGILADKAAIQIRMLNAAKGPAVRSLRAQIDKELPLQEKAFESFLQEENAKESKEIDELVSFTYGRRQREE